MTLTSVILFTSLSKHMEPYVNLSITGMTSLYHGLPAYLGKSGCRITSRAAKHLIEKSGTKMQQLINEMDKLISYVGDKAQIDTDDVDAICTTLLSSRIFNMMDFIVSGKRNDALKLYADHFLQ